MARGRTTSLTIRLTPAERQTLLAWQRATTISAGRARRGRIILLVADRMAISAVAATVGISRRFVYKWVQRFLEKGLEGLVDKPGRGYYRVPRQAYLGAAARQSARDAPQQIRWSTVEGNKFRKGSRAGSCVRHRWWLLTPHGLPAPDCHSVGSVSFYVRTCGALGSSESYSSLACCKTSVRSPSMLSSARRISPIKTRRSKDISG